MMLNPLGYMLFALPEFVLLFCLPICCSCSVIIENAPQFQLGGVLEYTYMVDK